MRILLRIALLLLPSALMTAPREQKPPVTILVSIDGFRADYLDRGKTPRLTALAAKGVRGAMRPSFPSVTFPNHWTLVTGLVPDHHGIVANKMEDPKRPGETFEMKTEDPFWWSESQPVWVDAEKAGIRAASFFWPGSSVAVGGEKVKRGHDTLTIGGTRPSDWIPYGKDVDGRQRVQGVLDWMRRPEAIRPRFVTLYFDIVDTAGHHHGPDSPEVNAAIAEVDGQIGMLVDGLAALGQPANLVIVADHGMANASDDRVILGSDLANPADFKLLEKEAYATFAAVPGHEAALEKALLAPHNHVQCWRKDKLPARFRYGTNARVADFVCLCEMGWAIQSERKKEGIDPGQHGYDPASPEMRALFIANGPRFVGGTRLPVFDNVDVAPLLRDLIGVAARKGDGSDAVFRGVLKSSPVRGGGSAKR